MVNVVHQGIDMYLKLINVYKWIQIVLLILVEIVNYVIMDFNYLKIKINVVHMVLIQIKIIVLLSLNLIIVNNLNLLMVKLNVLNVKIKMIIYLMVYVVMMVVFIHLIINNVLILYMNKEVKNIKIVYQLIKKHKNVYNVKMVIIYSM